MSAPNEIPRLIHYCWFGGKRLSATAERSVATWADVMSNCPIARWDETNFDTGQCSFSRGAFQAKKWAFVSDYVRFKVLQEHGGIYMDVGSRLLKPIDSLLAEGAFTAREWDTGYVNPGLIVAAEPHNPVIEDIVARYENLDFHDDYEFLCNHTVNRMFTQAIARWGFENGPDTFWKTEAFTVYPSEFFCPKWSFGGYKKTNNTYAVHRFSASWMPERERVRLKVRHALAPFIGDTMARKIARIISLMKRDS